MPLKKRGPESCRTQRCWKVQRKKNWMLSWLYLIHLSSEVTAHQYYLCISYNRSRLFSANGKEIIMLIKGLKVFQEMTSQKCKLNSCTYIALINSFAREGLCEKAEEIFEKLQEAGIELDVYAYTALMEAYSRAGFPYGATVTFSLMQHMGCEPDRASFNIMVDAYGRYGLYEDARLVFQKMKRLGIETTMKSPMVLLLAYSKVGSVLKCEEIVSQCTKLWSNQIHLCSTLC